MSLSVTDVLGIKHMTAEDIEKIIEQAESFKEILGRDIKKVPTLRGKTMVNMFFEPSTRTRTSFELAGKILSADVMNISGSSSSSVKGESMHDTALTIQALKADLVVIRHSSSGAAEMFARYVDFPVINAGDGLNEHPTQALLDLMTIKEKLGRLRDLDVVIVGDIKHSRVARSDIWALTRLGNRVTVAGPSTLIPSEIESMGVDVSYDLDSLLGRVDVVGLLRIQLERQQCGLFPSVKEYSRMFGMNERRLGLLKPDAIVMHPGPINRGVEITPAVAYGLQSAIEQQVTNGIAVRMALIYLLMGGGTRGE